MWHRCVTHACPLAWPKYVVQASGGIAFGVWYGTGIQGTMLALLDCQASNFFVWSLIRICALGQIAHIMVSMTFLCSEDEERRYMRIAVAEDLDKLIGAPG
jgi:hypothetical protein